MASPQAIRNALNIFATNYVQVVSHRNGYVEDAVELWEFIFKEIEDKYIMNGAAEFCKRIEGNFAPNANKFLSFLHKEYSLSEVMHKSKEIPDCDACDRGLRTLMLHLRKANRLKRHEGEFIVIEKIIRFACSCEAGQEQQKQGLSDEKRLMVKWDQTEMDVVDCWMTDAHMPSLPPEALCSEWRREKNREKEIKGSRNRFKIAVEQLDIAARKRDKIREEEGLPPIV